MNRMNGTTYDKLRGNLGIDNISIDYGHLIDDVEELKNRTIVFCLGRKTQESIYPMMIQCPNNFMIQDITGICSKGGTINDTKIVIQKINYYDFSLNKDNWVDIIDENNPIIFKTGRNTIEENYRINNALLSKDDLLRIKVLQTDSDITDITINIRTSMQGSKYKSGDGVLASGQNSAKVIDNFITADTMINVVPTTERIGYWEVDSYNGYFIITSDTIEPASVNFIWEGTKQ